MSSDYCDLSPYQRIGSAWNELSNARQDLPLEHHQTLTRILGDLDGLLMALHPAGTIEPIPFCTIPCRHCDVSHG